MTESERQTITPELVHELLASAQILIPETGVYDKLKSAEEDGRRLSVKMGFDPTSPDLHLGHAVAMRQLRKFQLLGHKPIIIIGDYTGLIGDPSGRNQSRPLATKEELDRNAETYISQLGKVIDIDDIEVHRNSEWLSQMSLEDIIQLLAQGTLSQVITRDDFRKRLDEGSPVGLHEIIYPFMQGMDSVAIHADIEVGGVDQLYAFQAARTLQANAGEDPQASVLMPLLRGLDGTKKMSKSLGNYIGLDDEPRDMFGKVMSIPDSLIEEYLRLASGFSTDEIDRMLDEISEGRNPMEVKTVLAENITSTYHDKEKAEDAKQFFRNQFQLKSAEAVEYVETAVPAKISSVVDIVVAVAPDTTRSQARRLIEQGALTVNGEKITDYEKSIVNPIGLNIKLGKRRFFKTIGE